MTKTMNLVDLCARIKKEKLTVAVSSSAVVSGGVFAIMPPSAPGGRGGEEYLAQAVAAGAAHVVAQPAQVERFAKEFPHVTWTAVDDPRPALGLLAQAAYGTDEGCPKVIGITGTNGKTTTTYLLERVLTAAGRKVGVLGTVEYRWPGHVEEAALTTPGCLVLHEKLAAMHAAGVDVAVMEVSSHALTQERVAGIDFIGALLTNVTQDHLDFHGDMEHYFQAKALLFLPPEQGGRPLAAKVCAVNTDDPFGRRLLELPGMAGADAISFGLDLPVAGDHRHLAGRVLSMTPQGMHLQMRFGAETWELDSRMVGDFNAMNLLGVQALCLGLSEELDVDRGMFAGLWSFTGVPGRVERVENHKGLNVFVDYAHTPDALVNVLKGLRAAGFSRIVTVFGCGGNRDRTKRPLMGRAVAEYSDVAVLTSDNPRDEEPEAIMADVMPGLTGAGAGAKEVVAVADRRAALAKALTLIGPNDALLVAGKGHETYQIVKGVKYDFSDQDILRELMK